MVRIYPHQEKYFWGPACVLPHFISILQFVPVSCGLRWKPQCFKKDTFIISGIGLYFVQFHIKGIFCQLDIIRSYDRPYSLIAPGWHIGIIHKIPKYFIHPALHLEIEFKYFHCKVKQSLEALSPSFFKPLTFNLDAVIISLILTYSNSERR
jgi:hypothetical protein